MDSLDLEEYRQLRATIRERGSLRLVLFLATAVSWALLAGLVAAFLSLPLASLLPLLLLMAGFETVHALHVGVERIGRYLYVNYESVDARLRWEGAIAAFGRGHQSSARPLDALFSPIFAIAILLNFLVAALGSTLPELVAIGAVHGLALLRVFMSRRGAAAQREEDQTRFEGLKK
ncbi:MAG: hypothetical protein WD690_04035 [Vicinamibacterales bacterium]